jgi:hypothetical protein
MAKLFAGDPVGDMEIAKRLIARHPDMDFAVLDKIAADRRQPQSGRIAAIYTLGFTDDTGVSQATLTRIASDVNEPEAVRDHATCPPQPGKWDRFRHQLTQPSR